MAEDNEARSATFPAPPLGRFYEIGGRRLLVYRAGSGDPSVVILPGAGAVGLDYFNVQQGAAKVVESIVYDRAGTGWSDRVPLPRSSTEVTDELAELLAVVGIDPPYLLVGHSLGGLYARHFATRFPEMVSGLVLLDPAHEDYDAFMPEELRDSKDDRMAQAQAATDQAMALELPEEVLAFYRMLFEAEVTGWPEAVRVPLIDAHVSPEWFKVGFLEATNLDDLYREIREAGPLPDLPMIVLCSMGVDDFRRAVAGGMSEEVFAQEIDGRHRLYEQFASSIPKGECRPVEGVGHVTMHLRRGNLVLAAINDVLRN